MGAIRRGKRRSEPADLSALEARIGHVFADKDLLLIAGSADQIADVGRQSRRLHHDVPGSEVVVVPGLGHMIHHLAPERVVAAVARASERLRPAA